MKKKFDCVKWVREIRDKNFEKYKDLDIVEFHETLCREARGSDLWKELNLDSRIVDAKGSAMMK